MMLSERPPAPALARLSDPSRTMFIPEGASIDVPPPAAPAVETEELLSPSAWTTPGSTRSLAAPTSARNQR